MSKRIIHSRNSTCKNQAHQSDRRPLLHAIVQIREGAEPGALRSVAVLAGIEPDRPLSATERASIKPEPRHQLVAKAQRWRRAAIALGEELLGVEKAALFDSSAGHPDIECIQQMTRQLARWRQIEGDELLEEFESWADQHPGLTGAMIHAATNGEVAELRAIETYLSMTDRGGATCLR